MCSICLIEDNNYIKLECGHTFHKECINKLLHYSNKCPMCRKKIFNEHICDCFYHIPYVNLKHCRYCFGLSKKDFFEKYSHILKN